jgi:alkylation response protein AidB-like acyl-CoA dehydrogenase
MQQQDSPREELLADVEAIAPILAEHAPGSEKLGRLDDGTLEALHKTRLLRSICPRELGGVEADPVTLLEVFEALARIDASASWVVGISGGQ